MGTGSTSTQVTTGTRERSRSVVSEGLMAGFLGATSVALWFLVIDFGRGRPLLMPAALGHALLHATGLARNEGMAAHVLAYTVFHYFAFLAVGVVAALVLRQAEREPSLLAGAFLLFAVFEVGFYLLTAIIAESPSLGLSAWYLVAGGNLLAAIVMGIYLWRAHPRLGSQLDHALSGREPQDATPNETEVPTITTLPERSKQTEESKPNG